MGTPTISYANWCDQLGTASGKHGSSIAFGAETYDAWARGTSPDAYAKSKAPKKKRAKKKSPAAETERQRLERVVEERAAAARYSFKHGLRENETDRSNLIMARHDLARRIAQDLGHTPLKQGISYECNRCGASGTFDVEPSGGIFTEKCRT